MRNYIVVWASKAGRDNDGKYLYGTRAEFDEWFYAYGRKYKVVNEMSRHFFYFMAKRRAGELTFRAIVECYHVNIRAHVYALSFSSAEIPPVVWRPVRQNCKH